MVENVLKKEITCYNQFLLFSQCLLSYITLVCQNAALCGIDLNLIIWYKVNIL